VLAAAGMLPGPMAALDDGVTLTRWERG
jgi:hypothetical protein